MRNPFAGLMPSAPFTACGDPEHTVFSPHLLPNGSFELLPLAKVNIKDEINSHADECDLSLILNKIENGDFSALCRAPAVFGDGSEIPGNLREFLDVGIEASRAFDLLPHELRSKFNSLKDWVSAGAPASVSPAAVSPVADSPAAGLSPEGGDS
nr:virion structural protein [Microvirus sp.]